MPRGQHPNSLANLKKGTKFGENAETMRKAVEKSVEVRAERRSIAEEMRALLDADDGNGNTRRKALAAKLVVNMDKSPEWYKLGLRMCGELPPEQLEVIQPDFSELDKVASEMKANGG